MTAIALPRKRVLADVIPGGLVRDVALVLGGSVFIGLLAQFAIPLPNTPVPLTLGTFAVLLTGAALGPVRGLLSVGLYMVAGMAGMPWFAERASGWGFPSFGYIIGFVLAGALVGWLAQRGADRTPVRTAGTMVLGNLVIYAVGLPYLMVATGMDLSAGLAAGVTPFLVGDAIKIVVAAGLLPGAWKLVQRIEGR